MNILLKNFLKVAAGVVFLGGVLGILGWVFDVTLFKSVFYGMATMKFTTAVCFVFTGIILFFAALHIEKPSDVAKTVILYAVLIILLLMGTILLSGFLGISTGLENLFIKEIETLDQSIPGRPSAGTIVSFLLVAIGGIIIARKVSQMKNMLFIIGVTVAGIGLVSLGGYVFGMPMLFWKFSSVSTAMAFNTSILFILTGTSFALLAKPQAQLLQYRDFSSKHYFQISLVVFISTFTIIVSALFISNLKVQTSAQAIRNLEAIAHYQELRIQEAVRKYHIIAEGVSSRTLFRQKLVEINALGNLGENSAQIQKILQDAMEPVKEVREIAVFDEQKNYCLSLRQRESTRNTNCFLKIN